MPKALSASVYTVLVSAGFAITLNLMAVGPALASKIIGNG